MRLRASRLARPLPFRAVAAACGAASLLALGCSVDVSQVFSNTGAAGSTSVGGGGAGGDGGSTTTSSDSTTTTSSTTTTTSSTTTTTTTSTTTTAQCGNGVCDPGETSASCSQDCPANACAHSVCQAGQALQDGCSQCVTSVCDQNPNCCTQSWGDNCIGLANQLCGGACCGNGQCAGESCGSCPQDCGTCPPRATCPHRVCFGGPNAEPLNTTDCHDPCVDEVCAVIDEVTDNCCIGGPPAWSAECTAKAKMLCGEYACIKDVCAVMPTCCTQNWTSACVDLVEETPSCATECNCQHGICSNGPGNTPLSPTCDPCVDAICQLDSYCCEADWDNICVGEVETICGIICN